MPVTEFDTKETTALETLVSERTAEIITHAQILEKWISGQVEIMQKKINELHRRIQNLEEKEG